MKTKKCSIYVSSVFSQRFQCISNALLKGQLNAGRLFYIRSAWAETPARMVRLTDEAICYEIQVGIMNKKPQYSPYKVRIETTRSLVQVLQWSKWQHCLAEWQHCFSE